MDEFICRRGRKLGAQQTFRRSDDERLNEVAFHLAPQHMKILRGGGWIADLDVILGARLEKSLEARAGVLRALPFIAMRQKQNNPAGALPLRFRRHDELIDDGLRAIGEIAELRLPKTEHSRIIK